MVYTVGLLVLFGAVGFFAGLFGLIVLLALCAIIAFGVVLQRHHWDPSASLPNSSSEESSSGFMSGLWELAFLGLILRIGVAVIVNTTSLWMSFGRDALTWEARGRDLLDSWLVGSSFIEPQPISFFPAVNALAIAIFGQSRFPVSFLNAVVGVGVAVLAGQLAYLIYDRTVARRAVLLVLFYPSLILWSAMDIRDVWAHGMIIVVLIAGHRARERFSPLAVATLLGALIILYAIRPYLLPLLVVALGCSFMIVRPRQAPYAFVTLAALGIFVQLYSEEVGLATPLEEQLERIHQMRMGLAYGGSAYGADVDTRTVGKALAYLPVGIARFMFSPFPWDVRSWQQMLALPESMVFFVLSIQALRSMIVGILQRPSQIALPVSAIIVLAVAYSLVSGNEGTAFRHRAQVVVITLIFAAAAQIRNRSPRVTASS